MVHILKDIKYWTLVNVYNDALNHVLKIIAPVLTPYIGVDYLKKPYKFYKPAFLK